jgi:streptomycin 3"-adenylyltransferase
VIALDGLADAEARQVLTVLQLLDRALGDALVSVILHGSAVGDGLRPDSDLDLLAVSERRLAVAERRALIDGLLDASRSRRDPSLPRHLEVTLVVRSDVSPWRYPPRLEFQYGDWWRTEFEAGVDAPWVSPNPDLAIVLSGARANGRALVGPPPETLLDPVPRLDLETALFAIVPDLLAELADDTRNVLLTLARVVRTLGTGIIEPKDRAADAVATSLEAGHVDPEVIVALRRAAAAYRGDAEDAWDDSASQAIAARAATLLAARIDAQRRTMTASR